MEATAVSVLYGIDWYHASSSYALHLIKRPGNDISPMTPCQEQIDHAPPFTQVMKTFKKFLEKNGLIDPETGRHLARFAWCTDGPWDVCDFVVKQCFISKVRVISTLTTALFSQMYIRSLYQHG